MRSMVRNFRDHPYRVLGSIQVPEGDRFQPRHFAAWITNRVIQSGYSSGGTLYLRPLMAASIACAIANAQSPVPSAHIYDGSTDWKLIRSPVPIATPEAVMPDTARRIGEN